MLADDRDAVGVAVLDQHAGRCGRTPRRAARAARSVRWWLFSAISSNFACWTTCSTQKLTASTENSDGDDVLQHGQPDRRSGDDLRAWPSVRLIQSVYRCELAAVRGDPPALDRARQQLDQLKRHDADHGIARAPGRRPPRTGVPKCRRSSSTYKPDEHDRVQRRVAPKNTTNRGSGCATMNCVPMMPGEKPDDRLRQPADADDAARQRVLHQAGEASRSAARSPGPTSAPRRRPRPAPDRPRPCRGPRTAPASSAARAPAHDRPATTPAAFTRAAPLGRLARRRRRQHDQHLLERREIDRRPDDDRACTRRRSSRPTRPGRSTKPFGIDAVDARRHDDVADDDVGDLRHVLHPQPIVAAADDDALRARPLDERAGRGVAVDQQLHLRGARRSARRRGRRRRPARSPPCRPQAVARALVDRQRPEVGRRAGGDDLGGGGLQIRADRGARAAARGRALRSASARCSCSCDLRRRRARACSVVVLGLARRAGRRSRSSARRTPTTPADVAALHLGEDAEGRPPRAPARRCAS